VSVTKKLIFEITGEPFYDNDANDYYIEWFGITDSEKSITFHHDMVEMLEKKGWNMFNLPKRVRVRVEIEILEEPRRGEEK
jgi:hypothetical protein